MAKEYSNTRATCVVAENRTNNMMRVKLWRTKGKKRIRCHTHVIAPSKGCFFAFCLIIDAANNNILIGLFIFIHLHRRGERRRPGTLPHKEETECIKKIVKRIVHTRHTQFNYVYCSARRRWILYSFLLCAQVVFCERIVVCALFTARTNSVCVCVRALVATNE